jgi:hypothetical protein
MKEAFSQDDLRSLFYDLKLDFEELPPSGKTQIVEHLIHAMQRQGRLDDLLTELKLARPRMAWPTLAELLNDASGYFSGGVRSDHPFVTGLANFYYYYLGDEANPVAFGGRNKNLTRLDKWRQTPDAPPRLLLTALAGQGKSALLAQWSKSLKTEQNIDVIFIPISVRFNTNREEDFYSFLANRLAYLHQSDTPSNTNWLYRQSSRSQADYYLREGARDGRLLLIIIDGLDEAAWQPSANFLPLQLPERVRVVVSARSKSILASNSIAWLNQLGWEHLPVETHSLKPLDELGIRDVLQKIDSSRSTQGQWAAWASKLYDLTQGDPLLLALYVKKLTDQKVPPQPDWSTIQPGYVGYFDGWWEQQKKLWGEAQPFRELLARDLLNLLALAHGPLQTDDLQALLPAPSADSLLIQETFKPFYRLVIGNGQNQGYVFAHIKLADYFIQELSQRDRTKWTKRFLQWGNQTLAELEAGQLSPADVSPYLMRYFSSHLVAAESGSEQMLPLISQTWLQVWQMQTGSPAGFVQDMTRVWNRLNQDNVAAVSRQEPAPYLGQTVLAALCIASIKSQADNLPDSLLSQLLQAGLWTPAQVLAYIRQRHDLVEETLILDQISPLLDTTTRQKAWQEMVAMFPMVANEGERIPLYLTAARYVPGIVREAIHTLSDGLHQAQVLAAIAPHLSSGDQLSAWQEALRLVRLELIRLDKDFTADHWYFDRSEQCEQLLVTITSHLPEATIAVARERQLGWYGTNVTAVLTAAAPVAPDMVLDLVEQIFGETERAEVLAALAPHLPQAVLAQANSLQKMDARLMVLLAAAPYLADETKGSFWPEVLATALTIEESWKRSEGLHAAAPHMPQAVLTAVLELPDEQVQAKILADLAPFLPQAVLTAAQNLSYEWDLTEVLSAIAPHLPEEVLAFVTERKIIKDYSTVLVALAPYRPQAVLDLIPRLWSTGERVEVITAVLPHAAPQKRLELAAILILAAQETDNESQQMAALKAAAPYLPEQTVNAAQHISGSERRAAVLLELSYALPDPLRNLALEGALDASQKIGDKLSQIDLQAEMAAFIPEDVLTWASQSEDEAHQAELLAAVANWQPKDVWPIARQYPVREANFHVFLYLARHLPEEILSVADRVWDYSQRARLLIALAPFRPAAVLDRARQLGKEEVRPKILVALLPFFQAEEQKALVQETWKLVDGLPPYENKSDLLCKLAPYLPDKVFQSAASWENEIERVNLLTALAPYLPESILTEAQQLDQHRKWKSGRAAVLAALAPYAPESVLAVAQQDPLGLSNGTVLAALAPYLPELVLSEVEKLHVEDDRLKVISAVLPHLPDAKRQAVVGALMEDLRQTIDPAVQATKILALFPYLSAEKQVSLLPLAWASALKVKVLRAHLWDPVLDALGEHLLSLPDNELCKVWHDSLVGFSRHPRPNLLKEIRRLLPVINRLGGANAVRATWHAVQTAASWWP